MKLARAAMAVISLGTMTACYPIWLGNQLDDRVSALDNASQETRAELDESRRVLAERVAELEETLDRLSKSATRTTAEVAAATDDLLRETQRLRGQLEEMTYKWEDVSTRFDALEKRIAALGGEEALKKLETKQALEQVQRPSDKEAFFALAKGYHDKKEFVAARTLFEEFVSNAKWRFDDRAPEAQLLIGDGWFASRDFRAAILAYQKVRETWPKSRWMPDALYKLGLSFLELGMKQEAVAFLEEAARFTGQQAGKAARAKLTEIKKK